MIIPKYVTEIIGVLEKNGHKAFLVGGAVRDLCLQKEPKDYDVATSATPEEIKPLFDKVIPTGEKHGTMTVVIDGEHCEVTTFRTEGKYSDSRRPDSVAFTTSIEDDLGRRDFTINAMAYGTDVGVVDPFGGQDDIRNRTIRAVGDPDVRFKEDPLRMLRAIRIAAQLGFSIENKTIMSIKRNSYLIQHVSKERIRDEFCKTIVCDRPGESINLMEYTNLISYIVPELLAGVNFNQKNPHHDEDVFGHILSVLDYTPSNLVTRLGAIFHDIAKPWTFSIDENEVGHFYKHDLVGADMAEEIMQRLKFDLDITSRVRTLVREHMNRSVDPKKNVIKKQIARVGVENIFNLFDLQVADVLGHKMGDKTDEYLNGVKKSLFLATEIINHKEPMSVRDLAVNGHDMMSIGLKGIEIGNTLKQLLDMVLDDETINTKQRLMDIAIQLKG